MAYNMGSDNYSSTLTGIKNALLPIFVLSLLEIRPMYVSEMVSIMERESGGTFTTAYPYDVIFRLTENEYMIPEKKRQVDGRRRQLYAISDEGREYLEEIKKEFQNYMGGIDRIWDYIKSAKSE